MYISGRWIGFIANDLPGGIGRVNIHSRNRSETRLFGSRMRLKHLLVRFSLHPKKGMTFIIVKSEFGYIREKGIVTIVTEHLIITREFIQMK